MGLSSYYSIPSSIHLISFDFQVRTSKQDVILDVSSPFQLPDGSPSFKDYSKDRNNRYTTAIMAKKNRIHPPSRTLHYWNAPPKISNNELLEFVRKCEAPEPQYVFIFCFGVHKYCSKSTNYLDRFL